MSEQAASHQRTRSPQNPQRTSRQWLLLTTAIIQAVSPALTDFNNDNTIQDPPIVPPGAFFAIWGVVIVGCLAISILGLSQASASTHQYRQIQVPLSFAQIGFALWCLASSSPNYVVLTPLIFASMLSCLSIGLRRLQKLEGRIEEGSKWLLEIVLGLYAGWSTAALWINVATLLPRDMLKGSHGLVLQCVFVAGASVSAIVGTIYLDGLTWYVIGAGWALTGVILSAVRAGIFWLTLSAAGGLAGVVGTAVIRFA